MAIPRRTFLESETKLAEAKAALARAESRLDVSKRRLQRAESAVQVAQSRVQLSEETYQTRLRQLGASAKADGTITITAPIAGSC